MEELKKAIRIYMVGNSRLKSVLLKMLDQSDVKNKAQIEALTAIASPSTADAEDCAVKINEIIAALKA